MYSIYSYPVDVSYSSHYARDNIKSYIFFCALSSMGNIVVSPGWLVVISIFTISYQLEIKIIIITTTTTIIIIIIIIIIIRHDTPKIPSSIKNPFASQRKSM